MAMDKNVALSSLALRKSGEALVNVVQVKLNFVNLSDEDRKAIRMGFTADVYIQTTEFSNALTVNWSAVRYDRSGNPFAIVAGADGSRETRTLKLGRSGIDRVEVLDGLKENEKVLDQSLALASHGGAL